MLSLVQWVHLLALAVWLGETVFLSFVVAPTLFRNLASEEAGRVMGMLFPNYYRLACGCGFVLLATGAVLWRTATSGALRWGIATVLAALMLTASVYAGAVIQPRARTLRPQLHDSSAPPDVKAEFDRLHRHAVQLNAAVLVGNLLIAGVLAWELRAKS